MQFGTPPYPGTAVLSCDLNEIPVPDGACDLDKTPLSVRLAPTASERVEIVPVKSLVMNDSPRLSGDCAAHIRLLAESPTKPPPILVHGPSMRVIDGRHRVRAAMLVGEETIEAVLVDTQEENLFPLAVMANIRHGLPLSLSDRKAAAARIVRSHPNWSNRAIAVTTGLSPTTVAAIRGKQGMPGDRGRVGRDGRVWPLDIARRRMAAQAFIATRPTASLREIAKATGVSTSTARDVRLRIQRGEAPVPARQESSGPTTGDRPAVQSVPPMRETARARSEETVAVPDPDAMLHGLQRDPALRFSETGRSFLRWFLPKASGLAAWQKVAGVIPPHCKYAVARIARSRAVEWQEFATRMEEQADLAR